MAVDATEKPPKAWSWEEIQEVLSGTKVAGDAAPSICDLYRAIFCLRQAAPSQAAGISALIAALQCSNSAGERRFTSVLFRHECCYLLGQLGADCTDETSRRDAFHCLHQVLLDCGEDEVTRHEAAEGIAAVHSGEQAVTDTVWFLDIERLSLEKGGRGPLAETCHLAVEGIRRKNLRKVCACQYASHDPALGDPDASQDDIPRYLSVLLQDSADLFERYVAMFTLRNLGADSSLARVLAEDRSSTVLRHELAFVLGQMESEAAMEALVTNLADVREHSMVRHEAAIALGSIGGEAAKASLRKHADDEEPMVAESCQVALDTVAYWEAWERLEERMRGEDPASN